LAHENDTIVITEVREFQDQVTLENRLVLLVLSTNSFGRSFVVDSLPIIVGRHEECDMQIEDPYMSNRHFRLDAEEDGTATITDLHSSNFTYLNERRLTESTTICYGDRIVAGETILRLFMEEKLKIDRRKKSL
jgi:pSer/pThr/pTyr-binding forkhead associated (FHA) protein